MRTPDGPLRFVTCAEWIGDHSARKSRGPGRRRVLQGIVPSIEHITGECCSSRENDWRQGLLGQDYSSRRFGIRGLLPLDVILLAAIIEALDAPEKRPAPYSETADRLGIVPGRFRPGLCLR